MTLEADLSCLRSVPLFRSLPGPRLKLVALMGERLNFDAGTIILGEGEQPEGVYFILEGEAELAESGADGSARRFTFRPGSLFGDVPLLSGQRYIGELTAKTNVATLRLPKDLFFELLETIPDFSIALSRDLASRLYRLADSVLHSGEKVH